MLNLNKISGFDWDTGNSRKSEEKHGISRAESEQVFFNDPLLLVLDDKHSRKEIRYHAYGKTNDGRKLHITFTLRESDTLIRVISARNMHRKEKMIYDKA